MSSSERALVFVVGVVVVASAVGHLTRPALGWLTVGSLMLLMAVVGRWVFSNE